MWRGGQGSFERRFGVDDTDSDDNAVTRRGSAGLEFDGLRENGDPNVGVYCGIRGGGSGTAGIAGGLDHLWYCRTSLTGFSERDVLCGMLEQNTGQNTRLHKPRWTASRRNGRGGERRGAPISELYIITRTYSDRARLISDYPATSRFIFNLELVYPPLSPSRDTSLDWMVC
jgi:hypothetical protein